MKISNQMGLRGKLTKLDKEILCNSRKRASNTILNAYLLLIFFEPTLIYTVLYILVLFHTLYIVAQWSCVIVLAKFCLVLYILTLKKRDFYIIFYAKDDRTID